MNRFFSLLLVLVPFSVFGLELKVGDILLQPRDCWSCSLIEAQENSIYSHMAMVIQTAPELKVIDALGTVKVSTFSEFDKGTQKNQNVSVRRFRNDDIVSYIQNNESAFVAYYLDNFDGLQYDHDFIWNNFDENGYEKLYCSEMVTKLLSGFLRIELPMKKMKFDKNRDQWIKYFRGNPPDGKWGNAPADYEKSELFYEVGEL